MEKVDPTGFQAFDVCATREWVAACGYEIRFRHAGWFECLLSREGERWHGSGPTEEAALEHALRQAFPSAAARAALLAAMGHLAETSLRLAQEPEPKVHDLFGSGFGTPGEGAVRFETYQPGTPDAARPEAVDPFPTAAARPDDGNPEPALALAAEGAETYLSFEPASSGPASAPAAKVRLLGLDPVAPAQARGFEAERPPSLTPPVYRDWLPPDQSISALNDLCNVIDASMDEMALLTPERQRLHLQVWVCEARSHEEIHPGERGVSWAVGRAVKKAAHLAKLFWPGSTSSMRMDIVPAVVMEDHPEIGGPEPGSWWEARELVRRAAEKASVEARAPGGEEDEFGWADARALMPPPGDPAGLLEEIHNWIEKRTGELHAPPEFPTFTILRNPASQDVEAFVEMARKTRWLRLAVPGADRVLGLIMGRLRAVTAFWGPKYAEPLLRVLSAEYRPVRSWAAELGIDPGKRARQRKREFLFEQLQSADAQADLMPWLVEAFAVFNTIELAGMLSPLRAAVLGLPSAVVMERLLRRRLASLQERLAEAAADAELEARAAAAIREESAGADDGARGGLEIAEAADAMDPVALLIERVRRHTTMKRALLVSNRNDEELASALKKTLDFERVSVAVCDPRRTASAVEAIANGSYEFVLAVTGFLPHCADGALSEVCKRSGTRLVRVGKGRPQAVVRAMGRMVLAEEKE